jgi:UDP-2,4-diacetamido-2,4,6-trideoxy-beta-L-altropyranose hydrolase
MMEPILLRADASTYSGVGHVMRCLAMAQAWQDAGGAAHFAAVELPDGLAERLGAEGMVLHRLDVVPGSLEDAAQVAALAQELGARWVVIDGYHFGTDFQSTIKDASLPLLTIDDYGHAGHYFADLVLNQNIQAEVSFYPSREPTTRLLLGTQYVLLRREFRRWCGWRCTIRPVASRVLVTLGGSDPDNVTLKVIEALEQVRVSGLEVLVVAGAGNPHLEVLQTKIRRSRHHVELVWNVSDMPKLMVWAELAVSASGSTCWELAFMGVPTVSLSLAENQMAVAAGLENAGAVVNLGWHASLKASDIARSIADLLLSPDKRHWMSQHGQEQVDGNGAARVTRLLYHDELLLRPVRPEDCHLIWQWASDSVIRAHSFHPEPILWEQHVAWFDERLADPFTQFYLAVDADAKPIGQIRFQVEAEAATVSVSLALEQRGKGYGAEIIRLGSRQIWTTTEVTHIHAYVKPDNGASARAFAMAGYASVGAVMVRGCSALHFLMRRPQGNAGMV